MLIACKPDQVRAVQAAFAKWDLDAVEIGRVTADGRLRCRFQGEVVVDIPVSAVVDLCPVYQRPWSEAPARRPDLDLKSIPEPSDLNAALLRLLASPTIANKEWVYRQYDHMVLVNTVQLPGAGAAVLRIKGSPKGLAMTLDGNGRYTRLDPRAGGKIAVAEACRNLACVGARPIGVTNCLNFGNPEKPEVMGQFKEALEGLSEACLAFDIAVTGGNVSFYNDTEGLSIDPTPVLGIVGLIEDLARAVTPGFKDADDAVILLGETLEELGGSEYLQVLHDRKDGRAPEISLAREKAVQEVCLRAIEAGWVKSAHDPSEGGLAVCAAECAFHSASGIGCDLELGGDMRADALLFGESQSRILLTASPERAASIVGWAAELGAPARIIGRTGGTRIRIRRDGRALVDLPVAEARAVWMNAIPELFKIKG
jgi:phosphoribosylformylglycinamidine synthase